MVVKGEILIVGDEILNGETLDTNSGEVARALTLAGFFIASITAIRDDVELIKQNLLNILNRSDFVVVTGGLGPTWDDLTVQAVSEALNLKIEKNEKACQILKQVVEKEGLSFDERYQKMALLPQGAEPLGIAYRACGFKLLYNNKPLYFLPGVPYQMRQILKEKVVEDLKRHFPQVRPWLSQTLRIFGLNEIQVEQRIATILNKFSTIKASSLPRFPEVHLILRSPNAAHLKQAVTEIKQVLGDYLFSEDGQTLEATVGQLLAKKKLKLATAESLTGGLIGHLLTQVPGSSEYFDRGVITYSNQAKMEILGVPAEVLRRYGAVSEPTARYMAEGVKRLAGVDIGLAVTGYAGPTAGPEGPVGTVFIGLSFKETIVKRHQFTGNREQIKLLTAYHALDLLRRQLL